MAATISATEAAMALVAETWKSPLEDWFTARRPRALS
jgi:hypothetical protein